MDRQTTLAFVLIGIVLVVWLYLTAPKPEIENNQQTDSTTVVIDTLKRPVLKSNQDVNLKPEKPDTSLSNNRLINRNSKEDTNEEITTVENDVFIIEFSNKGGNIHKVFLKKFKNWYSINDNNEEDYYKTRVQLINYSKGNAYDLSFVSVDGKAVNTADFFESNIPSGTYQVSGDDSLKLEFSLKIEEGKEILKRFIIRKNSYEIGSDIELIGMGNLISNNAYDLVWNNGLRFVEKNSVDEATASNSSVYYGDEQVIMDSPTSGETEHKEFNGRVDWIAVRDKYFATVIIPKDPTSVEGAYIEAYQEKISVDGVAEFFNIRLNLPFRNTNYEKKSFKLYIGPVDYNTLKELGDNLTALVDFGSFFGLKFIVRPIAEYVLLPLFNFLHLFIPNYGFVIVVFSLIIKIVVYPLTKQSYQSMKKMQLLQPKIAEIKEKYKDDQQKVSKETMKLYQTYGVNPAGGCLPMLLQMPIFIALWGLFRTAIELRQQPFILWIKDLSQPDVIYNLGFKLPLFGIKEISGLALLMGITTFIQQKMTMKDPKQQAMVYIMPIFLTILFMSFPSGLNLYYFLFNLFSIAQQQYINHQHSGMELVPVKNPKKKQGFMSRLMEAAEEQKKMQQKRKH